MRDKSLLEVSIRVFMRQILNHVNNMRDGEGDGDADGEEWSLWTILNTVV